jgi:hypothetical protein
MGDFSAGFNTKVKNEKHKRTLRLKLGGETQDKPWEKRLFGSCHFSPFNGTAHLYVVI